MRGWRCSWSMVGRWLVYVPHSEEGEIQLSFPKDMKAEAHKIAAADQMLAALKAILSAEDAGDRAAMVEALKAAEDSVDKAEGRS